MKRITTLLLIILLFLFLGVLLKFINHYYTFEYLYYSLFKKEFAPNPKVDILLEKDYQVDIWYYSLKLLDEDGDDELSVLGTEFAKKHPNIQLRFRKLNYLDGQQQLCLALSKGCPPDIYLNICNDSLIDSRWQIPVEQFITNEERVKFYTVDWKKINLNNHLWAWPFLVQEQGWLLNQQISLLVTDQISFIEKINLLKDEMLLLNYSDITLLRQLLSLNGLPKLELKKGKMTKKTYYALEGVFDWLHSLREKQVFAMATTHMEDYFLKYFLEKEPLMIGPVNPWLEEYLMSKGDQEKINLDQLGQVYSLAVFFQQDYQGDDHTRAVMEVARFLCEDYMQRLIDSKRLPFKTAYIKTGHSGLNNYQKMLEIFPEERRLWQEKIIPAWLAFWQEGLTPGEVMDRITKIK